MCADPSDDLHAGKAVIGNEVRLLILLATPYQAAESARHEQDAATEAPSKPSAPCTESLAASNTNDSWAAQSPPPSRKTTMHQNAQCMVDEPSERDYLDT